MGLFDRKTPSQSERTNEERERARAEREARRAERAGLPAAPVPPAEQAQTSRLAATQISQPAAPAVTPPRPFHPDGDGALDGAIPVDGHVERAAAPPPAPAPRPAPARRAAPAEAPSAIFDEPVSEDWSRLDAPAPRRPLRGLRGLGGVPPRPPAGPDGRPGAQRPRRWPLAVLGLLALATLAAVWLLLSLFQPFHGDGGKPVSVTIPRGAGMSQAADLLAARGVIGDATFFKLRAKLDGASDVKAGAYVLPEDSSYGTVLAALAKGPPPPKTTDITISEGRTIGEADKLLRKTDLRGSYATATRRARILTPQQYGAPRSVTTKEGFLFPATYKLRVGASVSDLVTKQLQAFRRQFATVNLANARSKKLNPYDVLIIASMIEREAGVAKDRPLIASVIYNRLKQGIPLGIDATIRYQSGNWQQPLRMSELRRNTPYNTRLHKGLPPTPIGNPGLASIRAAAHPARTSFLYFVVKPCGKGEHAFVRTDAEFQRAAQHYERARQAQGRSPVNC
jgi:uncharacterized YceG family protein